MQASLPLSSAGFPSLSAFLTSLNDAAVRSGVSSNGGTQPIGVLHVLEERSSGDGGGGVFHRVFGRAAEFVADEFLHTRADVKLLHGCASVNVNLKILRRVLADVLLQRGMRVVVWRRTSSAWEPAVQASPGDYMALDEMFSFSGSSSSAAAAAAASSSSTSMALCKGTTNDSGQSMVVFGAAFVDQAARTLEVCEFSDGNQLANVRAVIQQKGVRECVVQKTLADLPEGKRVLEVLEQAGVPATVASFAKLNSDTLEQDLKRLAGSIQQQYVLMERVHAMQSMQHLITQTHPDLLRDESGHGRFRLSGYDLSQYMRMDGSAMRALNLFPQPGDSHRHMNLFGWLNQGCTPQGVRLLSRWLKQPLMSVPDIERRQDLVQVLVEDPLLRQALLEQHLKRVPDLRRLSTRFQRDKASLETVIQLYSFTSRLPALVAVLDEYDGSSATKEGLRDLLQREFVQPLKTVAEGFRQFEAMVEATIDLDALARREYMINPGFHPRLTEIDQDKQSIVRDLESERLEAADTLGLDESKVKLNNATQFGYHLRVSRKEDKALRKHTRSFTVLDTRKDGVRFTSPVIKRLARRYSELQREYNQLQASIVAQCLEITATYCPIVDKANDLTAELDVYVGLAQAASNAPTPYTRPQVLPRGSGLIELTASRHPCLEVQEAVSFIPNDVTLRKQQSNVQIITGPNMGGKSTFIRQVGVIVLMAQIGSFVPCASARITLVDCIMARVGAGDVQLRGVSTFMKEMLEASSILHSATEDSLVIIDELGRGTSTYDGFGLAWAIAEHLATNVKSFTLFATHFHELTALAQAKSGGTSDSSSDSSTQAAAAAAAAAGAASSSAAAAAAAPALGIVNKHVTAHTDDSSITMLYQVQDGPCDRSFGIHVSELANFPTTVVATAKRKAAQLEDFGSRANMLGDERAFKKHKPADADGIDEEMITPKKLTTVLRKFAAVPLAEPNEQTLAALKPLTVQLHELLAEDDGDVRMEG